MPDISQFLGPGSGYNPMANPWADYTSSGPVYGQAGNPAYDAAVKAGTSTFLGITPLGWGIIGVGLIGALFARNKKKRPPPEAQGITLGQPVDANAPWLKVYGAPWFSPPLMTQYVEPNKVNTSTASSTKGDPKRRAEGRVVSVLHTGAGPVAGTGLEVKQAGNLISSQTVTTDSPTAQQTLTHKDGTSGSTWLFPALGGDLVVSSVQITADGTLVWGGDPGAGGTTSVSEKTTVTSKFCKAEKFTKTGSLGTTNKDGNILSSFETRIGCFLPTAGLGQVDEKSVTATISLGQSTTLVAYTLTGSNTITTVGAKVATLKPDDWGFSQTDAPEGKQYFWVRKVTRSDTGAQALAVASASSIGIVGFTLSYSVKTNSHQVKIEFVNGGWEATFSPPLSSTATVKATYKTTTSVEDVRYSFRTGALDQQPVMDDEKGFFGPQVGDGTRTTVLVGSELTKGTNRTYTSTGEVDDLLLCIQTGEKGFYSVSSDGSPGGCHRTLTLEAKTFSAADAGATKPNDPTTGWVVLKNPNDGSGSMRLQDSFTGQGQWFLSVADLLAFTNGTAKTGTNSRNWLPTARYMVKVTAQDAEGVKPDGKVDTERYFSQIFLANATEVRRVGLVLPRQSTLAVAMPPDAGAGKFEVKFAGATVVQPSSSSATVAGDGLPYPRTVGYSRNPVWCACDLITDDMVGGGRVFSWSSIDIESAYTAAAWCDETVTFRDGSTATRSLVDVVVGEDGRKPLGEWLATILAGSGVMCYWKSGTWRFVVDEDADPVTDPVTSSSFTIVEEQDCLPGACELTFTETEERPTELVVQFRDSENMDAESQEPLYFDDPQPTPRITERVEFPAVRRRKQARYFGGILLRQMRLATRRLRMAFTVGRGLRVLALDPGDVVLVTSTRLGLSAVPFRVMTTGFTSGLHAAMELVEHVSAAYSDSFAGPNSGVQPGLRTPSDTPTPSQLKVSHVTGVQLQTVGGAP